MEDEIAKSKPLSHLHPKNGLKAGASQGQP